MVDASLEHLPLPEKQLVCNTMSSNKMPIFVIYSPPTAKYGFVPLFPDDKIALRHFFTHVISDRQ